MAKKVYRAVRTSEFMPIDQGNKWVVEAPDGDLIHALSEDGAAASLTQNEALRIAKELNSSNGSEHYSGKYITTFSI